MFSCILSLYQQALPSCESLLFIKKFLRDLHAEWFMIRKRWEQNTHWVKRARNPVLVMRSACNRKVKWVGRSRNRFASSRNFTCLQLQGPESWLATYQHQTTSHLLAERIKSGISSPRAQKNKNPECLLPFPDYKALYFLTAPNT